MNAGYAPVLLTLVLAALPSLVHLPLWVGGVALGGAALRCAGWRRRWQGKCAGAALLLATAAGVWHSFDSWLGGDAVLSFFVCAVFLKWAESHTRREHLLLSFAAVILAAVGGLYYENVLGLLHILAVVFALATSLVHIHTEGAGLGARQLLRSAGLLFLMGMPLALLLFLTFPRIPGPLWDVGLAFGLPVKAMMDKGPGEFGKLKTLQPGGIHRAGQENENVLVAEFQGPPPFKSRLYWRGPVFWEFDGENWNLPEDWDNRGRLLQKAVRSPAALDRMLRRKGDPVRYTLRVMPNGGRWLYGLDAPAAPAPEAFISEEMQLLSIRKIAEHEPKFPMLAYLEYGFGSRLTEAQRTRGLAFPEGQNPRLRALGRELAEKHGDAEEVVRQALVLLAEGDYAYDPAYVIPPSPPEAPVKDLLDRYFFDERRGGAEYLAGALAMLMRAAGVPARLVGGFRGGTIVALTDFVIVKRADAHAWLEVWLEDKGWTRVEAKDIVAPPGPEESAPATAAPKPVAPEVQAVREAAAPPKRRTPQQRSSPSSRQGGGWSPPDLASLFGDMRKWVIRYDPDRQMEILQGMGMEKGGWSDLLLGGAAGALAIFGAYLLLAWWRGRQAADPVAKAWRRFLAAMKRLGMGKAPRECPRDYLRRIGRERPELAEAATDIVGRYIDLRYGAGDAPDAKRLFRRQVHRFTSMT
ncbi:MAG: transglutaminaseTgpA domain-containing protein [Acidobacteriota bacterium]|jgi:transglutaminase-like putative cysteine protease|nr:transglutaminaseTgpA domain-containing protein [Acidobacteriota bacterium]